MNTLPPLFALTRNRQATLNPVLALVKTRFRVTAPTRSGAPRARRCPLAPSRQPCGSRACPVPRPGTGPVALRGFAHAGTTPPSDASRRGTSARRPGSAAPGRRPPRSRQRPSCTNGTKVNLRTRSQSVIHQGLVDELSQLRADRVRGRREQLGQEHDGDPLDRGRIGEQTRVSLPALAAAPEPLLDLGPPVACDATCPQHRRAAVLVAPLADRALVHAKRPRKLGGR